MSKPPAHKHNRSSKIFIISLILLTGCGLFGPKPGLENDRGERDKVLNGLFVTYWKGAKISIRSLPITKETKSINFDEIKAQQARDLNLGRQLSRIYDWEMFLKNIEEERRRFTAKEFMEFAREVYTMSETIKTMDEDNYPSFSEVISHSSRVLHGETVNYPPFWNNTMDHWLFAIVMETRLTIGSWRTYELDKVDINELETSDLRVLASLHKGLDHLRNEWFFLAEETCTHALEELNRPDITLQPDIKNLISDLKIKDLSTEEQFRLTSRAVTHLFRGFARHQTKDSDLKERAVEDVEAAITDFKQLGVENELVWVAESYLHIKNEEPQKAAEALTKLEKSSFISNKERKLIAQSKVHIANRDPDSALNILTDKVMMTKLGLNYALSYATEIEWMLLLEKTEEGRRILKRFKELEQTLIKAKKYFDLDLIKEKSKKLYEDLKNSNK